MIFHSCVFMYRQNTRRTDLKKMKIQSEFRCCPGYTESDRFRRYDMKQLFNAVNGSVPVGNTEMEYVSFGYGKKAFVLLPGLSDGLATVKGKALLLAPPYRMFFRNYTVYMFSRKNSMPEGYSIRDMAQDQAEALKKLGIVSAGILGVSEGGMIAQCLAADYPEMTEKLVLAVTSPKADDMVRGNLTRWTRYAEEGNHRQLMIDTAEQSYSEAYLKKFRLMYPLIGLVGKPKTYDRFLINVQAILHFDASDILNQITCPTLIIGGEKDKTVGGEASRELHRGIENSVLRMYPKGYHGLYEEEKDFNFFVLNFLKYKK